MVVSSSTWQLLAGIIIDRYSYGVCSFFIFLPANNNVQHDQHQHDQHHDELERRLFMLVNSFRKIEDNLRREIKQGSLFFAPVRTYQVLHPTALRTLFTWKHSYVLRSTC